MNDVDTNYFFKQGKPRLILLKVRMVMFSPTAGWKLSLLTRDFWSKFHFEVNLQAGLTPTAWILLSSVCSTRFPEPVVSNQSSTSCWQTGHVRILRQIIHQVHHTCSFGAYPKADVNMSAVCLSASSLVQSAWNFELNERTYSMQ